MKRFRVLGFDSDFRPATLSMEILDSWEDQVKAQHRQNKENVRADLIIQFGQRNSERKAADFVDLGSKPFSVVAFHNRFLEQLRVAFIMGAYYPAATAACALGERVLNHMIRLLRDFYSTTPEYRQVYRKDSFDNWEEPIRALEAWGVLLPEAAVKFRALWRLRWRAIHFDPATDQDDRPLAVEAIRVLEDAIQAQFGAHGARPCFIPNVPGETYVKKESEDTPFVREILLPNCVLVGPRHVLKFDDGRLVVERDDEYEARDISDLEFKDMRVAFRG